MCFSPNGERFAYATAEKGKFHMVVDGVRSKGWDEIDAYGGYPIVGDGRPVVSFSSDSKHYAYEVRNSVKYSIVLDGKEIAGEGDKRFFTFSPDGRRTAYVLLEQVKTNEWATCVVVDGIKGKGFDGTVEYLDFTPDSKRLIYRARLGHYVEHGGEFFVVNGKRQREYDSILMGFSQ